MKNTLELIKTEQTTGQVFISELIKSSTSFKLPGEALFDNFQDLLSSVYISTLYPFFVSRSEMNSGADCLEIEQEGIEEFP